MEHQLPSDVEQRISALQSIEEIEGLTREELRWIAETGIERSAQDGELIFAQGMPPDHLIFVLAGEVLIKRHTSSPVSVLTGKAGRITGKTPYSRVRAWSADGRALGSVWLLEIHESSFPAMLAAIPSMTERMIRVLIDRNREYTKAEEQIGKLSALSKLAGNLAHELNNPASAARSAAQALSRDSELGDVRYRLGLELSSQEALDTYIGKLHALQSKIKSALRHGISIPGGEFEEELTNWLSDKGLEEAWNLAPILAESDVSLSQLQDFLESVPPQVRSLALRDLLVTVGRDVAITSISRASGQIFRTVTAVKDYSYMDRQPLQEIDLAIALDNVLMMFQPRMKSVTVEKNIPSGLPLLQGYGSELNQAFSALIENSLDAMQDGGNLTLSVKLQGDTFLIEIQDDGRGIPEECRDRIFEPFFTTKPFGSGLGLGLDTVQRVVARHFGTVAFDSSSRGSVFHVRLPVHGAGIY